MLRFLRPLVLSAVAPCLLLLAPAAADAKPKSPTAKPKYPTVKTVKPRTLAIGQTLTITGKGFRAGKVNTVVFKRDGKPAIFARTKSATATKLTVVVPDKLLPFLAQRNGAQVATRFRLRILATKFSLLFTKNSASPLVSPRLTGSGPGLGAGPGAGAALSPYAQCQAAAAANPAADADADGLSNALERALGTDPCTADSDGDGVVDGFEYESALDLNSRAVPYPGKKPWPNPLDPSDVVYDFDGDGLTLAQEALLWKVVGGSFPVTAYSDGTQNTGGTQPTAGDAARQALDIDGDGNLTDDERDADGDGLSNMVELNYTGTQHWWTAIYKTEKPYILARYNDLDATSPDSDGDGIPDGADDQDHDGWSNYLEMQQARGSGFRVQPYNPCLPNPWSLMCSRYPIAGQEWPPFDTSQALGDAVPFTVPNTTAIPGWDGQGGA